MKRLGVLCLMCIAFNVYPQSLEESVKQLLEIPIFRAIFDGNMQYLQRLLNSGVDVNSVSSVYMEQMNLETEVTALSYAITSAKWDIARYLISAGADINQQTMTVNYNQNSQITYNTVLSAAASSIDSGAENFMNYLLSLNPVIHASDVGILAQTGKWRFVNLVIGRVPYEEKEKAVLSGLIGVWTNAYLSSGKVFTAQHINCVRLLLNQGISISDNGRQVLRNIQQAVALMTENSFKHEFNNYLNSAINN